MLDPDGPPGPMRNDRLFGLAAMAPVRAALEREFARYVARAATNAPSIGVGAPHDVQLFDRDALYSGHTRFVLAGIVNRMDRAYVAHDACGEIRLIYRLVADGDAHPSRLPMTLNLVLNARGAALAAFASSR